MENKPVMYYLKILQVLNDGSLGVNEIVKATGSKNKPMIIDFIHTLTSAGLIISGHDMFHKQKKILTITTYGRKMVNDKKILEWMYMINH